MACYKRLDPTCQEDCKIGEGPSKQACMRLIAKTIPLITVGAFRLVLLKQITKHLRYVKNATH